MPALTIRLEKSTSALSPPTDASAERNAREPRSHAPRRAIQDAPKAIRLTSEPAPNPILALHLPRIMPNLRAARQSDEVSQAYPGFSGTNYPEILRNPSPHRAKKIFRGLENRPRLFFRGCRRPSGRPSATPFEPPAAVASAFLIHPAGLLRKTQKSTEDAELVSPSTQPAEECVRFSEFSPTPFHLAFHGAFDDGGRKF